MCRTSAKPSSPCMPRPFGHEAGTPGSRPAVARAVEGTINGIGERAGNVALEEVIITLRNSCRTIRRRHGQHQHEGNRPHFPHRGPHERHAGAAVQSHRGGKRFRPLFGIHQHGILNCRETYEVMDPQAVGWGATELPLTSIPDAPPSNPGWNSWAMSSRKRKSTPSLNASKSGRLQKIRL